MGQLPFLVSLSLCCLCVVAFGVELNLLFLKSGAVVAQLCFMFKLSCKDSAHDTVIEVSIAE